MKPTVSLLAGLLFTFSMGVSAAPAVVDSDGDGIPDSVELAFGQNPFSFDSYPDTDGDGIPDFIETNLTGTDPNVDDSVLCAGAGGAANITGQWDTRIATNLANPVDFKTDELLGLSICQNGGVTVFGNGYSTSASFNGTNFSAQWVDPDETVTVTATYTAGIGAFSLGRLEGTVSFNGQSRPFRADRRALTPPASANVSAIYGLQVKALEPSDEAIDRPINPSNFGGQIVVSGAKGTIATLYTDDGIPLAGYYVPALGALYFKNTFPRVEDADNDTQVDDLVTETVEVYAMGLEAPSGKVGGMFRGEIETQQSIDFDYLSSPGVNKSRRDSYDVYGKAQLPMITFSTYNRSDGVRTNFSLNNVPTSADQISIAGVGLGSTDIVGGTSGIVMEDAVTQRSRFPGFTNGESVGISGNGSNLNITRIGYNTASGSLLTDGMYAFTVTGDADSGNPTTYSGTYTAATSPLPVATGLQLDGTPLSTSTALTDVRPGQTHTLTWNSVAGAAQYVVRIRDTNDSSEQWWSFTTGTSMTLDPRLFDPNLSYSILLEAREGTSGPASLNRSITDGYLIVTATTFLDVPASNFFLNWIEALALSKITTGCGGDNYCPDSPVTRAQMAVFLERGIRGASYTPPPCTGGVFGDVPCSGGFFDPWIEKLAADGITTGCGGGNYCPANSVTRQQMAIFLLRAKYGSSYTPPPCTGTQFLDVPCTGGIFDPWIEKLAAEGITAGCGGGNYCPTNPVTRAQMAAFLQRTFGLPYYEHLW